MAEHTYRANVQQYRGEHPCGLAIIETVEIETSYTDYVYDADHDWGKLTAAEQEEASAVLAAIHAAKAALAELPPELAPAAEQYLEDHDWDDWDQIPDLYRQAIQHAQHADA